MDFGEHIKSGRMAKKLKKSELAKRISISAQYLAEIETKGAIPSPEIIEKLVSVLDLNEVDTFKLADKLPVRIIEKAKRGFFNE